jgi:hypothetical protein
MKGIELLRKKSKEQNTIQDLPPLYTIFSDTYMLGRNATFVEKFMYHDELILLSSVLYSNPVFEYENIFSYFFDIEELKQELDLYKEKYEKYHKQGFITIGLFEINDAILLGVEENNLDEIWKLNGDWGDEQPYCQKLTSNIFEFVNLFRRDLIKINLVTRKINECDLYKNWGEDFWRVKK